MDANITTVEAKAQRSFNLRYYQKEAVESAVSKTPNINRKLIVMATGAGKTVVAAEILRQTLRPGERGLFVAHRGELLTQAKEKFSQHVPNVVIELEKASDRATRPAIVNNNSKNNNSNSLDKPTIVIGSIQTLQGERLREFPPDYFNIVIIDEAHHAMAPSYLSLVRHFSCGNPKVRTPLIGITATPDRQDGRNLAKLFQTEAYRVTLEELIIQGFLVRVRGIIATTNTDLSKISGTKDYNEEELAEAVDTAERNALVIQTWLAKASERKTIIFSASVAHAKRLAELINENGHIAEPIWGDMDEKARRSILNAYSRGEIQVLVNCAVLLEGYDEPSVDCIVLARPTRSKTIVSQCVGRGTRLAPNKKDVLVIDVRDLDDDKSAGLGDLFGMPKRFDPKGEDLLDSAQLIKDIDPALRDRILDPESLKKVHDLVRQGLKIDDFDVLDRKHYEKLMGDMTSLLWRPAGEGYRLSISENDHTGNRLPTRTYHIEPNTLGEWTATVTEGTLGKPGYRTAKLPGTATSPKDAFSKWDTVIKRRHNNSTLLDATATWNNDAASDKQLFNLFGMGKFKQESDVPKNLTKRQAGELINDANEAGMRFDYRRVPQSLRHVRPPIKASGKHFQKRYKKKIS